MDLLLVGQVSTGRFTVSKPEPAFICNSASTLLSPGWSSLFFFFSKSETERPTKMSMGFLKRNRHR